MWISKIIAQRKKEKSWANEPVCKPSLYFFCFDDVPLKKGYIWRCNVHIYIIEHHHYNHHIHYSLHHIVIIIQLLINYYACYSLIPFIYYHNYYSILFILLLITLHQYLSLPYSYHIHIHYHDHYMDYCDLFSIFHDTNVNVSLFVGYKTMF